MNGVRKILDGVADDRLSENLEMAAVSSTLADHCCLASAPLYRRSHELTTTKCVSGFHRTCRLEPGPTVTRSSVPRLDRDLMTLYLPRRHLFSNLYADIKYARTFGIQIQHREECPNINAEQHILDGYGFTWPYRLWLRVAAFSALFAFWLHRRQAEDFEGGTEHIPFILFGMILWIPDFYARGHGD